MKLPTLYKKTSTGAIQFWTIEAFQHSNLTAGFPGFVTIYGQVGTESPQTTADVIKKGKNIGKANETTAFDQAKAEAQAKWEKQKKKGYVETQGGAEAGELDDLIEGGIVPMLAHKFTEKADKIKYPAYVQPKLDGIRCIAILNNGKCTLWSRTRKLITGVPHIANELERLFPNVTTTFDGELYLHAAKTGSVIVQIPEGTLDMSSSEVNFEKIVSMVRQQTPAPGHEIVEYHVYDLPTADKLFCERAATLNVMPALIKFNKVKIVQTNLVQNEDEVMAKFEEFRAQGYEGAMVRNSSSKYVNKRSADLLKVKEFDDAEFPIVGVEEGRGKLAGHAIFVCKTKEGTEFLAKMKGDTDRLKEFFNNHSLWKGKQLTVKYQGLTGKSSVPRFPIGVAIRDYE